MNHSIKEVIDLDHKMFHDMPNIGGAQVAFWPISSFDKMEKITTGKVSIGSRMM